MNKSNQIIIRISDKEKQEIKARAEAMQMSMSEYILMLIRRDEAN